MNKNEGGNKRILFNNKGITLIALVITIVVLLILAAVTINLTLGENGLLNTTQKAAGESIKTNYDEQIKIIIMEANTEKYGGSNETLIKIIKNKIEEKEWCQSIEMYNSRGLIVEDEGNELLVTTIDGYEIGIKVEDNKASILYVENIVSKTYTITYDSNDGTNNKMTQQVKEGKKAILKSNSITRDNYTFVGWIEEGNTEKVYQENGLFPEEGIHQDITLKAKWSMNTVGVVYKGNGGVLGNEDTEITARVEANSKIILPENTFNKENYKFVCWVDKNNVEHLAGSELNTLEEDIELTAKWELDIISAEDVSFTPDDSNWKVTNVQEALEYLYNH